MAFYEEVFTHTMLTLLLIVSFAILISFLCSIFEAVLLSVTPSYIATLKETNPFIAAQLDKQKQNIDSPLVYPNAKYHLTYHGCFYCRRTGGYCVW
jgi:hypothetical protein